MGTRNLTAVKIDGAYKIAQYGQWDGYPSGQGVTALAFLRGMDREAFVAKVRAATFITKDDTDAINAEIKEARTKGVELMDEGQKYGYFSRDRGAEILKIVADAEPGIKLQNSIGFAGDGLFCEWAYVIDFDANTFEVFTGFGKEPLADTERFHPSKNPDQETSDSGYSPVRLVKSWPLDQLPDEDAFLDAFREDDEDESEDSDD